MGKYNVVEIANLLDVNEETVRRWIRSGELKSTQNSKKIGNIIDEQDLIEFVRVKPKYRKLLGVPELQIDDTYYKKLNDLLNDLINERNRLNERIDKIQVLLKEL